MKKYNKVLITIGLLMGMLSGCTNQSSPEEKIHTILEATVQKEHDFETQQEPITELETKEKEIYGQIIKLGMTEFNQIVTLSDEALDNLEQREELIEKERTSILDSREEFGKIDEQIDQIEDKELQIKAKELKTTMIERYDAHEDLYNAYTQLLDLDKKLYTLFKKEDLKMDELQTQIDEINKTYDKVIEANTIFNEKTENYNKKKTSFYQSADIEIATETEEK